MSRSTLTSPFPWTAYSKKCTQKIENPKSVGFFDVEIEKQRQMRVVEGRKGSFDEGALVSLYLLVDPEDGMIVDAKFQAFGSTALIASAEAIAELVIHKYYDQAKRIGADLIDRHLRDKSDTPAIPENASSYMNLVLDALDEALQGCDDIILPDAFTSPVPKEIEVVEGGYPGFDTLSTPSKLAVIEEVVKEEIRPYIELDGGGIEVINIINGREVIVMYKGSCTSCFSSTGATLSYIQQMLQAKVHPDIVVVPEFE